MGEFVALFVQIEKTVTDTALSETFKAPLLLSSMDTSSPFESTIAALRMQEVEELSWKSVTADLIQYKNSGEAAKVVDHQGMMEIQGVQKNRHFSICWYLMVIRRDTVNHFCFSYIAQKCILRSKECYFLLCRCSVIVIK